MFKKCQQWKLMRGLALSLASDFRRFLIGSLGVVNTPDGDSHRPDRPRLRRALDEIKREFGSVTKILVITSGVAWFAVSAFFILAAFQTSRNQISWERWWHNLSPCVSIWISFVGFTGMSVAFSRYRQTTLAFLTAVVSLVTLWNVFGNRIFG